MTRQRPGRVWHATAWTVRLAWRIVLRVLRVGWAMLEAGWRESIGWKPADLPERPERDRRDTLREISAVPRRARLEAREPLPARTTPTAIIRPRFVTPVSPAAPVYRPGIETVHHDPALLVGGLCGLGFKKPAAQAAVEQAMREHPGAPTSDLLRAAMAALRPK